MLKRPYWRSLLYSLSSIQFTLVVIVLFAFVSILSIVVRDGYRIFDAIIFQLLLLSVGINLSVCLVLRIRISLSRFVYPQKITGGDKTRFYYLGSFLVHSGALMLLVAGWISFKVDTVSHIKLSQNDTLAVSGSSSLLIKLDSFRVELTKSRDVSAYISYVKAIDSDCSIDTSITVNRPFVRNGWYFYQSSYGKEPNAFAKVVLSVMHGNNNFADITVKRLNEAVPLGNSGLRVIAASFFCNFMIDMNDNSVVNRSEAHENPAFLIHITDSIGDTLYSGWSFPLYPEFHGMADAEYQIRIEDYEPRYYTVLKVRKHTCGSLIMMSMVMISAGLFAILFVGRCVPKRG